MLGSDDTTKTPTVEGPTTTSTPPPAAAPPPLPPAWSPPRADHSGGPALVVGIIIVLFGLWFLATTTFGLELPRIDWRQYWPVILIVIGLLIVLRALRRGR